LLIDQRHVAIDDAVHNVPCSVRTDHPITIEKKEVLPHVGNPNSAED
jgi:type IV pilus biogenesis protein CpaD/CtpE